MKAILEFELPEDNSDFTLANNGFKYWSILSDIDNHLRGVLKYGHKYKSVDELAEEVRRMIDIDLYDGVS